MMLVFGVVGYVFKKLKYPLAPLVLALVLGDMAETAFRQSMLLSQRQPVDLLVEPAGRHRSSTLALVLLFWPLISRAAAQTMKPALRSRRSARAGVRRASAEAARAGRSSAPCPSRCAAARATKCTRFGTLKVAISPLSARMIAASSTRCPAAATTTAVTASPKSAIGHADDRRLDHAGQRVDALLDFLRIDVEAAGDDHVLRAADDPQVALRVAVGDPLADVAGAKPAVGA